MRLAQLSEEDRPREKLLSKGAHSLSVVELIAILLRTGTSGQDVLSLSASLLEKFGGLEGLTRATPAEIMSEKGLKGAKCAALLAVLELGKRISMLDRSARNTWRARADAIADDAKYQEREMIYALFLDAKDKVIDEEIISYGGLSGAYMDMPVFYRRAVRLGAFSIVLLHNHPDGSLYPSREDVLLTENVQGALATLGIKLKGHYIAADGCLTQVQ